MRKIDRTNEININNQGCEMQIIEYKDSNNITIQFLDENKAIIHTKYERFKNGNICNPFYPTVYNIGYIGNTTCSKNGVHKYSYKVWRDMLSRCYNKREQSIKPNYKGCSVCKEWLCYENFEKWYNNNYYELKNEPLNLDKDIMIRNNKIYSPTTCLLVPKRINQLFININTNHKYTEEKYHKSYKEYKEPIIKKTVLSYKDKLPLNIYDILINYEVK